MKKCIKFSLAMFLSLAVLIGALIGISALLGLFDLVFRVWVFTLAMILGLLLSFAFFVGVIAILCKVFLMPSGKQSISISRKIISVAGMGAIVFAAVYLGFFGLLATVRWSVPEHTVVRDNVKMIAEVDSFRRVFVKYYDYRNFIIRGKTVRIQEYYGEGSFDPFTREPMPTPKTIKDWRNE